MASEKMTSTKLVLHIALTITLVVLLPSLGRAQSETVKLGDLAAISNAAVYIAIEKGFFKEQGVVTEISNFASAAKQVPALVAGELEVSVGSASAGLFNAVAQQAPFRIVADKGQAREGFGFSLLTVRKDLVDSGQVKTFRDLKGKKIGVSLIGDSEDRFTTLFVERGGLSAKDVTKISLGTSPGDRILAIKRGGVSAVVLDPAATVMAEREGLRSLAYLGDMFPLPFQGYVTTHQKIAENPAQVKSWIRAMVRSLIFLRERPEEAAEIVVKQLRFRNITRPILIDAIKSYVRAFPQGIPGMPSPEGIKNILEYEVRLPMKMDESIPAEKLLDLRWVQEVKKEFERKNTSK